MGWMFSFKGRIGRAAYAPAALAAMLTPHLALFIVWWMQGGAMPQLTTLFWLAPSRWTINLVSGVDVASNAANLAATTLLLLSVWASTALALRRANDARLGGWITLLSIVPIIQFPTWLVLSLMPSRADAAVESQEPIRQPPAWVARLQGAMVGIGLTLASVAMGALVFRSYGFAMFIGTPVVVGMTTAFIANRAQSIGGKQTLIDMTIAMVVAGLMLIAVALEGVICILMAFPLAWGMGAIGAMIGLAAARFGRPGSSTPLMSLAILPLMFMIDVTAPTATVFTDTRSVEVEASAMDTWAAVIRMETIAEAPPAPFRLGVAYPVRGEVIGEGVGATRKGYFSTGVAVETVTEWEPGRALGFDIISEPPVLRELSPYAVSPPHVDGYFRSIHARIVLTPVGPNRTRLTLVTSHELDLQPAAYWLPLTRAAVQTNKARVLKQMRTQAEATARFRSRN